MTLSMDDLLGEPERTPMTQAQAREFEMIARIWNLIGFGRVRAGGQHELMHGLYQGLSKQQERLQGF
jgi:hypothetical protein